MPLSEVALIRGWIDADNPIWDLLVAYHNLPHAERDPRVIKAYQAHIGQCVNLYCQDFPEVLGMGAFGFEDEIRIDHVKTQDEPAVWQCERTRLTPKTQQRHLVFMTYLTTVETDAWTQFKFQKIDVKPQKGLTLIWPADWTWTYRDLPADNKYRAIGWLGLRE